VKDGKLSGGPSPDDPRSIDPSFSAEIARPHTSISTDASTRAERFLVDHLHKRPITRGAAAVGDVVTVTGEIGSGKTHLAWTLIEQCSTLNRSAERPIRAVYLDLALVTAESFYDRFVAELPLDEMTACVRDYHTDLVGRQITDPALGERVKDSLRSPGLTPRQRAEYIERFGLSEATLLVQLQSWLEQVVRDRLYATAFTFLLREGLDLAAWSWLRGNPPAKILLERGFGERAETTDNFADLVPFAQLYEHQQYRLVLILDNLDQLRFPRDPERRLRAFGKMVEQLREAGAIVFLLSIEDAADGLGLARSRRARAHIDMPLWDAATVERFLRQGASGSGRPPFRPDTAALIADLTGGQAAVVNSLTTRLRAVVERTGAEVSADVVRREAADIFATIDRAGLMAATSRVLEGRSWYYRTDHELPLREGPPMRVDFWIRSDGGGQAGCVLIIVDVPVDSATVDALGQLAAELGRAEAPTEGLVLVTGELSGIHAVTIGARFGREPLVYAPESFDADLEAAVKAMRHVLADSVGETLAAISDRVDALDGQQTQVLNLMQDILEAVHGLPGEPARSMASAPYPPDPATLPPAARRMFDRARAAVMDLGGPDAVGNGLFSVDTATQDAADATLRRLTDPANDVMMAVGAARAVLVVVDAFQAAVEDWFRLTRATGRPTDDMAAELDRLCDRYAGLVRALPLDELRGLTKLPSARRGAAGSWDTRYEDARQQVQLLADEVRGVMRG
jgi:hypothetical protein